jgi:hypothetical protein
MKYLRKKGRWKTGEAKYVIEENGKYIKTVPQIKDLLSLDCPVNNASKPSCSHAENENKQADKFGQSSLNEPTEEEIAETLREISQG